MHGSITARCYMRLNETRGCYANIRDVTSSFKGLISLAHHNNVCNQTRITHLPAAGCKGLIKYTNNHRKKHLSLSPESNIIKRISTILKCTEKQSVPSSNSQFGNEVDFHYFSNKTLAEFDQALLRF